MELFERTGLLLTDDVFYRLSSGNLDEAVQKLAAAFGIFFQNIPIKWFLNTLNTFKMRRRKSFKKRFKRRARSKASYNYYNARGGIRL